LPGDGTAVASGDLASADVFNDRAVVAVGCFASEIAGEIFAVDENGFAYHGDGNQSPVVGLEAEVYGFSIHIHVSLCVRNIAL